MKAGGCSTIAVALAAFLAVPGTAHAQRAAENAVTDADDAFGTSVGLESTGIYSENDTRGFSPLKAGNVRIDGVYADPVVVYSGRMRESTAIRVGFGATDFPFIAPTGVVDHRFRRFPTEAGASFGAAYWGYGGVILDADVRLPIIEDHLGLTGGGGYGDTQFYDGSNSRSLGWAVRPIMRLRDVEIAPFVSVGRTFHSSPHTLVVVTNEHLPSLPRERLYLGQKWTELRSSNENYGATLKAALTDRLSLRGGLFHAVGDRIENYSEIFSIIGPAPAQPDRLAAHHRLIGDPEQDIHSTSGEIMVAWKLGGGDWQHRLFAGFRARNRYTETGGSDPKDFGTVIYGDPDPRDEQSFRYSPVNAGRVRHSSWMLGYIGRLQGLGQLNLGLQKARYRGRLRRGGDGGETFTRDDPWLYNAMLLVELAPSLSLYAGTERGLEDSGVAPENAANRNEQLPATRSRQYEGGLRWRFRGGQLLLNAFRITKPYFSSFQNGGPFEVVGSQRHSGIEGSLSGQLGPRLNLVAGAFVMKPEVTGPARKAGQVGKRPAGTPSVYGRIDGNYRTDIFGGLTATASLIYTGKRAVTSRPVAVLGNRQRMVPGYATLDLGVRRQFRVGKVPASIRASVQNVFDTGYWRVVAANVMYAEGGRTLRLVMNADF